MRVCAVNGMKLARNSARSRPRMPYFSLASTTIERPSGVSSASEASCAASASSCSVTPSTGLNSVACRLPSVMVPVLSSRSVSTSPAASTARPDIASTLKRTSRSMPAMPIADSSAPMVVGIKRHEQRDQDHHRDGAAGIGDVARDRRRREHEDDGQADQQDVERDLVRRLLALGALDQLDHAVDEGRARRRRDAHPDPVGQHLGAAGHGRAVAAGLADDRRRFAGDRRLVDRGDAFDDLAVRRNGVAGLDQHDIADLEAGARHHFGNCAGRCRSAAWPASRCACAATRRPAPCRGPRRPLRRSWRTAP